MNARIALVALGLAPFPAVADTLTAARVVRANAVIEPGDFTVADLSVPGALTSEVDITGLEARVTLYPGRPIMPAHVGPAAVVTRNQTVTLVYRQGGLSISTEGRALSRGGTGDTVRVMNLSSRNTVAGQVRADGAVEVTRQGAIH